VTPEFGAQLGNVCRQIVTSTEQNIKELVLAP
jgi:hypothetical protein